MHTYPELQRRVGLTIAATGVLVLLSGCGVSVHVGKNEVSRSDVETQVAKELAAKVNQPVPKVTCPGPLKAKVGASLDCDLVAQGDTAVYAVHVVVDSVKNGKVHFNAQVADQPKSSSGATTTTSP